MHIYIYIQMYIHICIYVNMRIHVRVHIYIYMYVYIYIHVRVHIYMYTCTCTYRYMYMYMYIYIYIYTCTYLYACMHVCMYVYEYICTCLYLRVWVFVCVCVWCLFLQYFAHVQTFIPKRCCEEPTCSNCPCRHCLNALGEASGIWTRTQEQSVQQLAQGHRLGLRHLLRIASLMSITASKIAPELRCLHRCVQGGLMVLRMLAV